MNRWERPATEPRPAGVTAVKAACGDGERTPKRRDRKFRIWRTPPKANVAARNAAASASRGSAYRWGNATGSGESSAPAPCLSRRSSGPAIERGRVTV
ncbi:MAG: hypothetical protein A2559_11530 [Deltaproteobacteria bacterium RIFOXYD2_FULL_66_9]|nr:MAG: hypothetical protein A2559_11530 [Deltaproteobacteria bacterium RIFOXYD2_FULL_66_9]